VAVVVVVAADRVVLSAGKQRLRFKRFLKAAAMRP
jgi:hypothetical protein